MRFACQLPLLEPEAPESELPEPLPPPLLEALAPELSDLPPRPRPVSPLMVFSAAFLSP